MSEKDLCICELMLVLPNIGNQGEETEWTCLVTVALVLWRPCVVHHIHSREAVRLLMLDSMPEQKYLQYCLWDSL